MDNKPKQTPQRSTMWTFIMYLESAPKNYIDILNNLQIPWIMSPLHDADLDDEGNVKKPHWHCAFFFDSLKSYNQVSQLVKEHFNAPHHVQIIYSTTGFFHYLTHAENPEKAQYRFEDIQYGAGFNLEEFLMAQNASSFLSSIIDMIEAENICEFGDLVTYARQNNILFLRLIINKAFFFSKYLDSRRYGRKNIKFINSAKPAELTDTQETEE